MKNKRLLLGSCSIRLAELDDAQFIVQLRQDEQLSRYISPTSSDVCKQEDWISAYKQREEAKLEYYYLIENEGKSVGTVRLYDFRGDSFCWGSWVIARGQSPKVAYASVVMVYDLAFDQLGFKQSHFDVMKGNQSVLRFHTKMGAKIVREDEVNHYLEVTLADYVQVRSRLLKIANRSK